MNLRHLPRQRVFEPVKSNSVQNQIRGRNLPLSESDRGECFLVFDPRAMPWASLVGPLCTPWTSFVGSLEHPVGPLGHLGDPALQGNVTPKLG